MADLSSFAKRIVDLHATFTQAWHVPGDNPAIDDEIEALITLQHKQNFDLWHQEDQARDPSASDQTISKVKRNIDALNQKRNDLITQIDEQLEQSVFKKMDRGSLPWNSETVGSIIDRLSIASLKVFHMHEQTERKDVDAGHLETCTAKTQHLLRQREDLSIALQEFINAIEAGTKRNKLYRQFKMYNDPTLNPKIYQKRNS